MKKRAKNPISLSLSSLESLESLGSLSHNLSLLLSY